MIDEAMKVKAQQTVSDRKKYITYSEAAERYGLGETTLRKMAKDCGALYKIGKAARIKVDVFDEYMETFLDETSYLQSELPVHTLTI